MPNSYPHPKPRAKPKHLRLASTTPLNEFGNSREEFEERIFRSVSYFNVIRFGTHNGSEIKTVMAFPEALAAVGNNPRALIYAVNSAGDAFCIPKSSYLYYSEVWLGMRRAAQ